VSCVPPLLLGRAPDASGRGWSLLGRAPSRASWGGESPGVFSPARPCCWGERGQRLLWHWCWQHCRAARDLRELGPRGAASRCPPGPPRPPPPPAAEAAPQLPPAPLPSGVVRAATPSPPSSTLLVPCPSLAPGSSPGSGALVALPSVRAPADPAGVAVRRRGRAGVSPGTAWQRLAQPAPGAGPEAAWGSLAESGPRSGSWPSPGRAAPHAGHREPSHPNTPVWGLKLCDMLFVCKYSVDAEVQKIPF